jgi:hypothetical protein
MAVGSRGTHTLPTMPLEREREMTLRCKHPAVVKKNTVCDRQSSRHIPTVVPLKSTMATITNVSLYTMECQEPSAEGSMECGTLC